MSTRGASVTAELGLRLLVPGGSPLSVRADMRYETTDPYAVHVGFHTGGSGGEVVEWTFARQLLTDGVTHKAGEGDVQAWPLHSDGASVVCLSLSSPSGSALFEIPLTELVEFLTQTYTAVPTGAESDYVDLDAELAMLLWSDPEGEN